jgi:hypothetical protein
VNPVNPLSPPPLSADAVAAAQAAISGPRLQPYLAAAGQDVLRALQLYDWNSAMAGAAFGLLESVEVAVRNAFNDALVAKYGPVWWRPDQPPAIVSGASLRDVRRILDRFESPTAPLSTGKFVSETSFGFWSRLTTRPYDREWRAALHTAFAGKPPSRKSVQHRMQRLKLLRNRIAHHEIIWSRDLDRDRAAVTWLLQQLDPHLIDWARPRLDRYGEEVGRRPGWAPRGTR